AGEVLGRPLARAPRELAVALAEERPLEKAVRWRQRSVPLEARLLFREERTIGAAKVLGLHAGGLRLGFRIDGRIDGEVTLRMQHPLGHRMREGRAAGKR